MLRLLGAVSIEVDGRTVAVGGAKPRRLLAALVVRRNSVLTTGELMAVLWGDDVPDSGLSTLQTYVARLRRVLPPPAHVLTEPPGYRLVVGPRDTDVGRFETAMTLAAQALPRFPEVALAQLEKGLGEWRGDALAEFAEEEWAMPEANRLAELRLQAREERLGALLAAQLHERAIGDAEAMTLEHPWRETPWRVLVSALHHTGRQGDALRAASSYRARLRDGLGLDPSPEFGALERDVATGGAVARPAREKPRVEGDRHPQVQGARRTTRLAVHPTVELIGREADLALIGDLFRRAQLVTLLGPGGIGKTQLALAFAATRTDSGNGGVAVIELSTVRDEASVVAAVATHLDVQTQQGRTLLESVLDVLATRTLLLVLDNCEHVLETAATFAQRLLQSCSDVQVLATSREPLGLPNETVYKVPTLPVAPAGAAPAELAASPAVALFLERSLAANADQEIDAPALASIAQLCRRLDGVPLAIELAAARTRALSPAEIIARLDDRFTLLTGSSRVADARHRSLRHLVDWSYELLDDSERLLFRRLSIFAGAFDLDAAERVCGFGAVPRGSVAPVLASLVDKSMVHASSTGPRSTYRLLETLRDYGASLPGPARPGRRELVERHRNWTLDCCERGAVGLHGPDEREWIDGFERMFDDLRLAVFNALEDTDVDTALRIVVAAREHAFRHLRYELIGWAETALACADPHDHALAAAALGIVAYGRFARGEVDASIDLGLDAIALARSCGTDTMGIAERALGNACFFSGDMEGTAAAIDAQMESAVRSGLDARISHALYMRSLGGTRTGEFSAGLEDARLAMEHAQRSGNPTALAQARYALGVWLASSDPLQAREEVRRSESHAQDAGNLWFELFARTKNLWLQSIDGDPLAALRDFADVIEAWHRAGDWANQWLSLRHVFGVCCALGEDELALLIHEALERAGAVDAFPFEPAAAADVARTVADLRARLGDHAAALILEEGRGTTSAVIGRIIERIHSIAGDGGGVAPDR